MTPCRFVFAESPEFDGFAYGTKWNGFDNVAVTPEVRDQIVAWLLENDDGDDSGMSSIAVVDGLVCLADGFATQIVEGGAS